MMIKKIVHTSVSILLISIASLVYAIPFLIIISIPQRKRVESTWIFYIIHSFYQVMLWCLFLPISIHGKKNLPQEAAIFVANHQSALDIPLLGILARANPHIWLARSDATASLLVRCLLNFFTVIVDLSSSTSSYRSIRTLLDIANGTRAHIMLFPEGRRYDDGQVHEFVDGFVFLAKKTGRPVVPVCILGVQHVYSAHAYLLTRLPVHVIIGEPMLYVDGMTDEQFKEKITTWFSQQIRSY